MKDKSCTEAGKTARWPAAVAGRLVGVSQKEDVGGYKAAKYCKWRGTGDELAERAAPEFSHESDLTMGNLALPCHCLILSPLSL
jgi:hypothetical protein